MIPDIPEFPEGICPDCQHLNFSPVDDLVLVYCVHAQVSATFLEAEGWRITTEVPPREFLESLQATAAQYALHDIETEGDC